VREHKFVKATREVIALKMRAIDEYIEEIIEPLADIGNPEKLIGKKYEEWTPQDRALLSQVYGTNEPNVLSDFIFRKEYKNVLSLEESL